MRLISRWPAVREEDMNLLRRSKRIRSETDLLFFKKVEFLRSFEMRWQSQTKSQVEPCNLNYSRQNYFSSIKVSKIQQMSFTAYVTQNIKFHIFWAKQ